MLRGPCQPVDNHTYRAILVEASRCIAASAAAPPASSRLGPARQPQGARACEPRGGPSPEAAGCSAGLRNRCGELPGAGPPAGQTWAAAFRIPAPLPRRPPPNVPAVGPAPWPIVPALAGVQILFVPQPFQASD